MPEVKTRLDIDSVLSQIDPGIVENITVIDGPYTSLFGPGFAFINVDLLPVPRYPNGPESHSETSFLYGSNGQTLYTRENILGGGKDWGARVSYGLRTGNDYLTGGANPYRVPSSYQKWDGLFAVSADLSPIARFEFDYIRCEMNNVELPGVVYDLNNSTNNQFNLSYIVQEDRKGPKDLVFQTWFQQTGYSGDALRPSKRETLYHQFFTLPTFDDYPVNTQGRGHSDRSACVSYARSAIVTRCNGRSAPLAAFQPILPGGKLQRVRRDCSGRRRHLRHPPVAHGRPRPVDRPVLALVRHGFLQCRRATRLLPRSLDREDPIITQFSDPSQAYYAPGLDQPSSLLGMAYMTGKWKLTDQTTFNAGSAFAMRMPDLAELYSDDPFVPVARFGNSYYSGLSTLSPEKNLQFDIGITTKKDRVSYGVRGFYAVIWDYILPVPAFIDGSPPGFIQRRRFLAAISATSRPNGDRISSRATSTPTPTRPDTSTRTWTWRRSAAAICSPRCSVWIGSPSTETWPMSAARTGTL